MENLCFKRYFVSRNISHEMSKMKKKILKIMELKSQLFFLVFLNFLCWELWFLIALKHVVSCPTWAPRHAPMNPAREQLHPPARIVCLTPVAYSACVITPCTADWKAPGKTKKQEEKWIISLLLLSNFKKAIMHMFIKGYINVEEQWIINYYKGTRNIWNFNHFFRKTVDTFIVFCIKSIGTLLIRIILCINALIKSKYFNF